jgi:thiamine-phosphate pyrophosphorylase
MYNRLQYISQGNTHEEQIENIHHALDAGCRWIQLRFKKATEKEFVPAAEKARDLCKRYHATFIINDNVAIARDVDSDGVHLGLSDMPIEAARVILGAAKIIGGTANTLSDVLKRASEKCNYVGLGPYRFTTTKERLSPILGIEGYQRIMQALRVREIALPVFAIGGIAEDDVDALTDCGIHGIAVSGMITNHPTKKELIDRLNMKLYAAA